MPKLSRMSYVLAFGLGIALMGCSDDEVRSDLNTDGAPRVVTFNVVTESELAGGDPDKYGPEEPTFCSTNADDKLNPRYCNGSSVDPVDDAVALPIGGAFALPSGGQWHMRIVLNELVDPDLVEDLLECDDTNRNGICEDGEPTPVDDFDQPRLFGSLAGTQPLTLTCGGQAISYDGWWDPSGSHLTEPPGPALFVFTLDYAATSSDCEVTLNSDRLIDKEDIRMADNGPFDFSIAPMIIGGSDPANEATGTDPTASPRIFLNGLPEQDTLAANVTFTNADGGADPSFTATAVDNTIVLALADGTMLLENTDYTITVDVDGGSIEDIGGGKLTGDDATITFTTGEVPEMMTAN